MRREPSINARVVALGGSNLTRGFRTVVATAREAWGADVEVLAALGHGRSYGSRSTFLVRTLPGILDSGLWVRLEGLPPAPTRALVTDVGNDILYGFSAAQTLAWVEEAVDRLQGVTQDITLTDLPLASIRRLSRAKYLLFRSVIVPRCRLSLAQVVDASQRVNEGLSSLAVARRLRFQHMRETWYGVDPIHVRPVRWQPAWREILLGEAGAEGTAGSGPSWREGWQLYLKPPERQWLLGRESLHPQRGATLQGGGRVSLF